jgi:hypothetical protein
MTCERCGADAVDARGRCRNCGWQMPMNAYSDRGSSPSLGETRAAEIPAGAPGRPAAAMPLPASGVSSHPGRSFGSALPPVPVSSGPTGRFCGTCGARLEAGRAFCGQCGTPIAATGFSGRVAPTSGSGRYLRDADEDWAVEDGDAPTEEVPDFPPPFVNPYGSPVGKGPLSGPYGAMGYGNGAGAPPLETPSGGSRSTRIVLGMICLFGSVVSAAAAIILALAK